MNRLGIFTGALFVAAVALSIGLGPRLDPGQGADEKKGRSEKPDKPTQKKSQLTLVKVDIAEEVDGRENTSHKVQYKTAVILLTAAIDVDSARKTNWDKNLAKYKPRKEGPPDFVVSGTARTTLARRPTWYEGVVAYVYRGEAEISVEDAEGNEVHRFRVDLERSAKERDDAIQKVFDVVGRLVTKGLMECEAIRSRAHPSREKDIEKILAKIEEEIEKFGGTIEVLSSDEKPEEKPDEKPDEKPGNGPDKE